MNARIHTTIIYVYNIHTHYVYTTVWFNFLQI